MHDDFHIFRRCITCPTDPPTCSCAVGEQCLTIAQGCTACATTTCVANQSSGSSGGGVSKGAIAGGVIGALILLVASVCLLFWYRRHLRAQRAAIDRVDIKTDVPASADAVLSRPDPVEKPRSPSPSPTDWETRAAMQRYRELHGQGEVIYANPSSNSRRQSSHGSVQSNPFTDSQSIQTTSGSSQSTNVIPIALVPHGSLTSPQRSQSPISDRPSQMQSSLLSTSSAGTTPSVPTRPAMSPDLGIRFDPLSSSLNLEHVNVSKESFRPPNAPYAHSQASGISNRSSIMTSGSFASDMLYEAPQIVTPASGAVRQVLGVAKAAVVLAPGSNPGTPTTTSTLKADSASRPPARSPLAQSSFGPSDVLAESDAEGQELEFHSHNPFGDEHSPMHRHNTDSMSTFGMPTPVPLPSTASPTRGTYTHPYSPPPIPSEKERPVSTLTQAASIIDAEIQGATLVRLASASSTSTANSLRSNNRMTSARFVSPSSAPLRVEEDRYLQDQQSRALAAAQSNGRFARRMSDATSVASAGGDSLLESFTFVPPSPISSRPPRSPLAQQQQTSGLAARQIQGMSNASALSTGSALEGYTFHIAGPVRDSELPAPSVPRNTDSLQFGQTDSVQLSRPSAPVVSNGSKKPKPRQRASLDTLALTADLSAFPLNFDEGR